ncbi:glucosamine-6-phosphate deaminase [Paenibacillus aestuarii]|uniref:Glucosamine-6-phosphate deaminase n=1 Tax=Paenibacillus aestuarii TaxID=516965 RepID=A0ABW0K5G0_9BACL|nr:glucosamine-6-phosphate deaminase [Paenibacillus aestuarii]
MNLYVDNNYDEMSRRTAEMIIQLMKKKPDSLVCMAAGNTPLGTFTHLVKAVQKGEVNVEACHFISLDEWVGLDGTDEGSCRQTLDAHFFKPCGIDEQRIHFFDAKRANLQAECEKMDALIQSHGHIDVLLLGVGMNGHLGFNEPGAGFDTYTHVVELDAVTKQVSAKYFTEPREVQMGITLGIKHMLEAETVILIADGLKKADIMQKALHGEVTNEVPVTVLQQHPNVHVCLDAAAASLLKA